MAQQSYLVKILSGSNMGGEIQLYSTSVLVGDSDDCDIILGDPFLEKRTFTMDIFEDSVTIKREGLPFYVDGKSMKESEFSARFYSVITVATTSFVVGETDVVWPDITVPESFTEEEETPDPESEEEGATESEEDVEENEEGIDENEDEILDDEEPISVLKNPKEFVKRKISRMSLSMILIVLIMLGIGIYLFWFWYIREPVFGSEEYLKNINKLLRDRGYENLRVGVRKPNLLIITGYVMKKEEITYIENLVYNKAPKVLIYIRYLKEILDAIQEYLTRNQIFLSVKYNLGSNTITFTGYLKDEELKQKIEEDWVDYLPIFTNIIWKIAYWKDIKPVLEEELHAVDLDTAVISTPYNYTIDIAGELTDPDIKGWQNVRASIIGTFSLMEQVIIERIERVRVREDAKIHKIEPAPDRMKGVIDDGLLTIMGVRKEIRKDKLVDLPLGTNFDEVMEKDPCRYISVIPGEVLFVGMNGEKGLYATGSMLPGNLKIKDILEKSIILENRQGTYIFCNIE